MPPSVDFHTPPPQEVLCRLLASPAPTQTRSGFRWEMAYVTDRNQAFVLKLGSEQRTVAGGFPQASVRRTHVVDRWIRLVHGQVGDPPRHGGGADGTEVEGVKLLGDRDEIRRLTLKGRRVEHSQKNDQGAQGPVDVRSHDMPPMWRGLRDSEAGILGFGGYFGEDARLAVEV